MGFETNAAALLLNMRRDEVAFGRVLTLGHQHLHLAPSIYRRVLKRLGQPLTIDVPTFADSLFTAMGAADVEALDASAYEGATRLHDLNEPVPAAWHEQFDLVFDGGTLEHVFNFASALKNCMQMVKLQGRFVSITLPNNWCGHGFFQFSPELFFRALSPENGFSIVEMYFADVEGRHFYRVLDPAAVGERVQLWTSEPVFCWYTRVAMRSAMYSRRCRNRTTTSATGTDLHQLRHRNGSKPGRNHRCCGRSAGCGAACCCGVIAASSPSGIAPFTSRSTFGSDVPRFKLTIEYAGTRYSGWQIQKNAKTVQGEIDRAVRDGHRPEDFELYGSGRTDAGVHALAQVAHLDVSTDLPPEALRRRLNDELPADINILTATQVPHRFHARHHAVARRYLYQIARRSTAFAKAYVWWVKDPLDVKRMREAAARVRRHARFPVVCGVDDARRRRTAAVDARAGRSARDHRRGRPRAGRHRGIAFSVEDGAADGRRARRNRPGRTAARCGPADPRTEVDGAGASSPRRRQDCSSRPSITRAMRRVPHLARRRRFKG